MELLMFSARSRSARPGLDTKLSGTAAKGTAMSLEQCRHGSEPDSVHANQALRGSAIGATIQECGGAEATPRS